MKKKKLFQTRSDYYPFDIRKYITVKNVLILLLLIFLYLLFPKYMQVIILMMIFYPISVVTARITKYMRGFHIETMTSFTLFLGYVYGWRWALLFGLGLGSYIWSQAGINQKTLLTILITGLCAFLGYWVQPISNFFWAYILASSIRNIISFVLFLFVNPDIFNNITHTVNDFIWHTLIMSNIVNAIYKIILWLT
ncbi:hypothetical protein JW930_07045 [Candidatus Woesearchaeota archaeon]|nr:hypothetical protein [Candidatus Woesearchaeota archaeon]